MSNKADDSFKGSAQLFDEQDEWNEILEVLQEGRSRWADYLAELSHQQGMEKEHASGQEEARISTTIGPPQCRPTAAQAGLDPSRPDFIPTGGGIVGTASGTLTKLAASGNGNLSAATARVIPTVPGVRPSHMLLEELGLVAPRAAPVEELLMTGCSTNYRGNHLDPNNHSADIPLNESCSFFILGLPPTITYAVLLAHIRNVGRIYATHINEPKLYRGNFTAAAKVVFFDLDAAQRFITLYGQQPFSIAGYDATVIHNRHRVKQSDLPRENSRAILVWGPSRLVNEQHLMAFFGGVFSFHIDSIHIVRESPDERCLEIRFGSWRCQAAMAVNLLTWPRTRLPGVSVAYTMDPCDVGWVPPRAPGL